MTIRRKTASECRTEGADRLWAPWRSAYVCGATRRKGCIFCHARGLGAVHRRKRLIVAASPHAFALLNAYPYSPGHLMVAPYRHVPSLENVTLTELTDMMDLLKRCLSRMNRSLKPHGCNIGINTGAVAGAGITGHVHIHLVPRWRGDTNFMPVTAGVRVMSRSLEEVFDLLNDDRAGGSDRRKR